VRLPTSQALLPSSQVVRGASLLGQIRLNSQANFRYEFYSKFTGPILKFFSTFATELKPSA